MTNEQTNEQKARELGQKYQTPCHGIGDCEFEAYKAAIEMAEWKQEQMIEKAVEWLQNRKEIHRFLNSDIEDFKKAMKQ